MTLGRRVGCGTPSTDEGGVSEETKSPRSSSASASETTRVPRLSPAEEPEKGSPGTYFAGSAEAGLPVDAGGGVAVAAGGGVPATGAGDEVAGGVAVAGTAAGKPPEGKTDGSKSSPNMASISDSDGTTEIGRAAERWPGKAEAGALAVAGGAIVTTGAGVGPGGAGVDGKEPSSIAVSTSRSAMGADDKGALAGAGGL